MPQTTLRFTQKQTQAMTPRLQYAVRLLQLSSTDYAQELQQTIAKNPFLEQEEQTHESSLDGPADTDPGEASSSDDVAPQEFDAEPDERDSLLQSQDVLRHASPDSPGSALDRMVADVDLRAHLHGQAHLLPLSARDHAMVCAVIESIDDDGYLRLELDEVGPCAGLEPAPDACEMSTALKLVQSFDPVGVAARSVSECLMLQLMAVPAELRETAAAIIESQLDRLGERDAAGIAKALRRPAAEIDAACQAIRRLDPRPGWRFGRPDTQYVAPDVVVRKVRGRWVAQLNSAVVPRLKLNQLYADLFQRHRHGKHAELAGHLQEARWALRNVEQRFSTILMVAQAILKRQYRFLEYGAFAMKPLGLREIADELGLHESTVCRVTNNKYMATPVGVFELKHFFSRAMPMAGGGACSATAIRGVMHELISAEDPARPLSDVEIAQRLARQGLTVARRTVTKYRQLLKVPAVERRRREAGAIAAAAPAG